MSPLDRLEKLLQDTLQKVGGEFHPSDPAAARERFLASRRRRRLYGFAEAGAAVGMAALAVIFIARANLGSETKFETAAEQPRVVATIDTTANPVAVAVGEGAVWMTDSEGGGIKKIDPETNEEIATYDLEGAEPDEVIVGLGYVWASDTDGAIHRINPNTGARETTGPLLAVASPEDVRLDIAMTTDRIVALNPATGAVHIVLSTAMTLNDGAVPTELQPNDIATQGDEIWAYEADRGLIGRVFDGSSVATIDAPEGDGNSDLAVGFDAAWIATGAEGMVYRVDLPTGDRSEVEIGGSYADLSIDITEEAVWALAIDDVAGTSEVFELDPLTAEIVSEPIQLPGVASDMSVGEGSVWVPDEDGKVRRISSEAVSPPAPDESAEAVTELPEDQLLYVFVRDDDLWAQFAGGEEQLTDTPQLESAPTVSADGSKVGFVRRVDADARHDIYELDLEPGGEATLAAEGGTEPAYGPSGELAWIVPPGGILPSNRATALMPWVSFRVGDREPQSFELFDVWQQGLQVTETAWDQTATVLYVETSYEGKAVHKVDVEIDDDGRVQMEHAEVIVPEDRNDGGLYQAPSGPVAPLVAHGCCVFTEGDQATTYDLGHAIITAEGTRYDEIASLDELDIQPGADVETASVGWVTADGSEYVPSDAAAYLVSDGSRLWLVDREIVVPLEEGITGFAAPFMSPF